MPSSSSPFCKELHMNSITSRDLVAITFQRFLDVGMTHDEAVDATAKFLAIDVSSVEDVVKESCK